VTGTNTEKNGSTANEWLVCKKELYYFLHQFQVRIAMKISLQAFLAINSQMSSRDYCKLAVSFSLSFIPEILYAQSLLLKEYSF